MRLRSLFIVLLLAAAALAPAQTVPDVDDFYVDNIHVLLQNHVQNRVVSVVLFLQGGCINTIGRNPLLESMTLALPFASGPATMTKDLYRAVTARTFTVYNADYGRDYSDLTCVCVQEYWNTAWQIFGDMILHPRYDDVEFERIRRQTRLNIQSRGASPDDYVRFMADSLYFQNHLYFRPSEVADVDDLTIDSIAAYHNELMVRSRMLLVVVGNITRDDLVAKIRATLSGLPAGDYVDRGFRQPARAAVPITVIRQRDLPTVYVEGRFAMPKMTDFDYWATVIATSMLNSRFFDELRTRRNLTYATSAEMIDAKLCYGKVYVTTEYPDSCIALMREQMRKMWSGTPSQTEINYHVNLWITSLGLRRETNISQAEQMGRAQIITGWWRNAFTIIDRLREVTPYDIERCAQRYFQNVTLAVLGDTTKIKNMGVYEWKDR